MNYVEISDLLSKGFTPEQIMQLVSSNPRPEEKPEEKPAPEEKPEEKPAPEEKPEEKPAPDKTPDPAVAALRDEIKSLKETLQKQNIINQHFNNPPETADAEKILAGIIRPPFDEPDKK